MEVVHNVNDLTGVCAQCGMVFSHKQTGIELGKEQAYQFDLENGLKAEFMPCTAKEPLAVPTDTEILDWLEKNIGKYEVIPPSEYWLEHKGQWCVATNGEPVSFGETLRDVIRQMAN